LNKAKFRTVNYLTFSGMRCDIEKGFWFDDDYILEDDVVMCALLDLYITVFEAKDMISREICN